MLWISFETPSVRDFRNTELRLHGSKLLLKNQTDYLKLIKNKDWELIWVYNKITKDYLLFNKNIDPWVKDKIEKLILLIKK